MISGGAGTGKQGPPCVTGGRFVRRRNDNLEDESSYPIVESEPIWSVLNLVPRVGGLENTCPQLFPLGGEPDAEILA
jgi:hypothetical protein